MTEADAILAVLAELGRAKEKWPPFGDGWAGRKELRKQMADLELAAFGLAGHKTDRELTQLAAVCIRMLAGV